MEVTAEAIVSRSIASGLANKIDNYPLTFGVVSSNAPPSPGRWQCDRLSCYSTSRRAPLIPKRLGKFSM